MTNIVTPMDIAQQELQHTVELAEQYLESETVHADILRIHIIDLQEDITTLEKYVKNSKDKETDLSALIARAKRAKREATKQASEHDIATKLLLTQEKQKKETVRKDNIVKAPRVQLPTFNGESLSDYRGFILAFNASLGNESDADPVKKWLLLKPQLEGKALELVRELPIAPETYEVALKILEDNFGGDSAAVMELYQRLQLLPNATLDTDSLKITQARMEGILMSLERLKVTVDADDFLRAVVIAKYPDELQYLLRVNNKTPLKKFREELAEYVASRASTIRQVVTALAGGAPVPAATTKGPKGGADGYQGKQRHGTASSTANGGAASQQAPPHQVTNNTYNKRNKKVNGRLHKCIFCKGEHWSDECSIYKTLEERLKLVAGRCQKCLNELHPGAECKFWRGCFYCQSKEHNRSICPKQFAKAVFSGLAAIAAGASGGAVSEFMTLMLQAGDIKQEKSVETRAILDTGGGRTLITSDLVEELALEINKSAAGERLLGVNKVPLNKSGAKVCKLFVFPPNENPVQIEAQIVDDIADNPVATNIAELKKRYPDYAGLQMPSEGNGQRVRLLLGYRSLPSLVNLHKSLYVAPGLQLMATKFGWIPLGDIPGPKIDETGSAPVLFFRQVDPLKLMTDLDAIGLGDFLKSETEEEEAALEKFHKTTQKIDGRYQIEWPWKYEDPEINNNFGLAWGRLQSLYKQLNKTPDMLQAYDRLIREQVATDILESVPYPNQNNGNKIHYLPHRAVIRLGKSTPVRMVFDASARCGKGARSLNENILKGGNWVVELPGVLLRFRRYATAVTSDIEKAFHQIGIAPKDRDVVRFLWLRDTSKPPTSDNICVYRFKRMAFGVIASPFLLTATIKHHLREQPNQFAETIESDLYADNLVVSLPKEEDSVQFYKEIKNCFAGMSMNISKWTTNDAKLRSFIPITERIPEETVSVLGLVWNTQTDEMNVKSPRILHTSATTVTKRSTLTEMAKVYDPLGWVLPVVLMARVFIRKLWLQEYNWDTPLEKTLAEEWLAVRQQLNRVDEIKIPRRYGSTGLDNATEFEIHTFCDASKDAYAVVIYLLSRGTRGSTQSLIASKAKLAPKNNLSTPRLELLAAVIATRYTSYVERSLKIKNLTKYLWGDSRCVIAWTTTKRVLPGFVEKSVKEIRSSGIAQFAYVPGEINPADVASRGATIDELRRQNWWDGPDWLSQRERWPDQKILYLKETENLEQQTIAEMCQEEERILFFNVELRKKQNANPLEIKDTPFGLNPADFSTLNLLIRKTVICWNVAAKILEANKRTPKQKEIDYRQAKILWLRWDQKRFYEPEIKKRTNVSYLRNLKVSLDENKVIRCLTRVKWAKISRDESEPILLVKKSPLTKLIVLAVHESNLHAGTSHTLAALRRKYWLPHGRREVFQIIKEGCHACRRYDAQPFKVPEMSPLPPFRITKTEKAFNNVGVDVFGPFLVRKEKNSAEKRKKWVVIFTCLVIRAVHLEILDNMETEEFLNSFRRFVARRGTPQLVISDNAPQFEVINGVFQDLWRTVVNCKITGKYYAQKEIKWKFIPAEAPWMGGVYERLIHTVKNAFRRVHGDRVLTKKQFLVAMIEVEAIINSRPITYVSKEKESEVITPNDFLAVRFPAVPMDLEKGINITTEKVTAAWRAGEQYAEEFWRIWSDQYLRSLRERRDKMSGGQKDYDAVPQPGELVLMIDPQQKRSSWRMAVVERLIPDDDGKIRAVQIKATGMSRMIRPVSKLASLKLLMDLPEEMNELNVNARTFTVCNEPGEITL